MCARFDWDIIPRRLGGGCRSGGLGFTVSAHMLVGLWGAAGRCKGLEESTAAYARLTCSKVVDQRVQGAVGAVKRGRVHPFEAIPTE